MKINRSDLWLYLTAPLWVPVSLVLIVIFLISLSPCLLSDPMKTKLKNLFTMPFDLISILRWDW